MINNPAKGTLFKVPEMGPTFLALLNEEEVFCVCEYTRVLVRQHLIFL